MNRYQTNRRLHAFLSVITLGLWLIVWLFVSIRNSQRRNQIAREYDLPVEHITGYRIIFFLVIFWVLGYKLIVSLLPDNADEVPLAVKSQARPKPQSEWIYEKADSPLGRNAIVTATVYSQNEIEFDPPFEGKQRGVLRLRKNFNNSHDAYFGLEKGEFGCNDRACGITARFDNGLVQYFEATPAQNEATPGVYLRYADTFINFAKSARQVTITAHFLDQRHQTFQFAIRDLDW